jgi:hypothetical protein
MSRLQEYSTVAQHIGTRKWLTKTEVREIGRKIEREGRNRSQRDRKKE